jgi:hypothetical protein
VEVIPSTSPCLCCPGMPLTPDAIVVRGGVDRDPISVADKVQMSIDAGSGAVLSVCIDDLAAGEDEPQGLTRICVDADVVHTKVQLSTLGKLLEAGFRVESYTADGEGQLHHHVYFEEPVTRSRVQEFVSCFGDPVPNPTGGKRRKR